MFLFIFWLLPVYTNTINFWIMTFNSINPLILTVDSPLKNHFVYWKWLFFLRHLFILFILSYCTGWDLQHFCLGPIVKVKTISSLIFMYAVGTFVCLFEGTTVYQTRCICLSLIPKDYLKSSGSKHLLSISSYFCGSEIWRVSPKLSA